MDKEELIIELLKESREVQKELTGIIIDHREATHLWQNDTSHRLNDIEEDLRAHKEGVVNNRALIKFQEDRLEALEAPKKAVKTLLKYAAGISTLVGAIYGVIKLL